MTLDPDAAYQALAARDARFDGRLFVGVTSTGVYCRPICRVRTPQRRNCRFFETPAQAEAASFRPCLKCRPEIAPGAGMPWSVMDASRTLARQAALELNMQAASGEAASLAALAGRLGVSDRHLRRIFAAEQGVTPMQYLQTRRLLLAKQLLTDTTMPVAQVALASGFRSLRRFNAAFAEQYRMSPSRLRGAADEAPRSGEAPDAVTLTLAYRAPFDHAALLRFVAQRAIPGIEEVDGVSIRRTLRAGCLAEAPGWVEARFELERDRVQLRFAPALAASSARMVAAARHWLDLDASPASIDAALISLPGAAGIRLPGSLDALELAVRAVLGQQVSVAAARTLARRVVERFGTPLATPWPSLARQFPQPEVLAAAPLAEIAALGIVRQRAGALIALADAWPGLETLMSPATDPDDFIAALCELPGIGPWTAHYIAMRAFGWPDAFPPNDVAVLKAMHARFGTASQRDAHAQAQAWRPWRAYAVLRLWNSLEIPR
ncbi:Ada metal-binding domain-containing protein [uncultured Piscinibacter sp.]|uniref:Ada metal-binding domain-containing protein n=1 Tax=uncultured Piscinibacter sp. TaxID=1131835 RepID=UPI0026225676|nr:Ada metal-binding domain-containing protein [uncultured Piscinibacter sp.]